MLPTIISQGNNLTLKELIALFHSFLDAPNRADKLAIYEQLVPLTLAPVGQVLNDQQSAVNFTPNRPFDPAMAARGLTFWESLLTIASVS